MLDSKNNTQSNVPIQNTQQAPAPEYAQPTQQTQYNNSENADDKIMSEIDDMEEPPF